jgi:hypothetical protein
MLTLTGGSVSSECDGAADPLTDLCRDLRRRLGEQHRELVTTVAGGEIVRSHRAGDASGDLDQYAIACVAAAAVVDRLEVVNVDHQDRRRGSDLGGGQVLVAVIKRSAVLEPGQRVAKRDLLERERSARMPSDTIGRCGGDLCQARLQSDGRISVSAVKATEPAAFASQVGWQVTRQPSLDGALDVLDQPLGVRSVKHARMLPQHRGHALATHDQMHLLVVIAQRLQLAHQRVPVHRHRYPKRYGGRTMLSDPRQKRALGHVGPKETHVETRFFQHVRRHPKARHVMIPVRAATTIVSPRRCTSLSNPGYRRVSA